jgi:predicted metal-dependent phosphoesterase TrpH
VNIVRAGLDGIETVHPQHDPYLQRYYEQFARAYHLLTTGGSDFHGSKYSDDTNLGKITIPHSCVEHLQQKLSAHRLPFE